VEFEWDRVKAASNVEKHAADFDIATEIFDDLGLFVMIDSRTYGERCFQAIRGASPRRPRPRMIHNDDA
jgi:uncharacterized DUF497 family protein